MKVIKLAMKHVKRFYGIMRDFIIIFCSDIKEESFTTFSFFDIRIITDIANITIIKMITYPFKWRCDEMLARWSLTKAIQLKQLTSRIY